MSNLGITQAEAFEWSQRNFGETLPPVQHVISPFLGMVEELGEIAHSILKLSQGIRGTREKHESDIRDGIGDLLIFTLDFCSRNGMNCEQILDEVWGRVRQRDWKANPATGGQPSEEAGAPPAQPQQSLHVAPVELRLGHCARCARGKALNKDKLCAECAGYNARLDKFMGVKG